jgi:hypothetical protein
VLSASFYIAWCSAKNRALVRLRRLREPRYLLGAIAGGAYLYFAVFARGRRPGVRLNRGPGGPGRSPADAFPPQFQVLGTSLGGLAVMVMAALVWVLPAKSGLLEFSQAETAFLFTAPVSRRQLLVHRLVRSQISVLIASLFIAMFATPFSGVGRVRLALGMWALLVTMRIYYAAVTLTRARLGSPVLAVRAVAWLPIGALLAGLAIVGTGVARQLAQPAASFSDVMVQLARVTATGLPHAVLWPFVAILRPPFAQSPAAFGTTLFFSLLVLLAVTVWLLASASQLDAVLEQGAEFRVEKTKPARPGQRPRTAGLRLAPTGRPDVAFIWKNATQTIRAIGLRELKFVPPALLGLFGIAAAVTAANGTRGPAALAAAFAVAIAGAAVVFGPQMVRSDLRGDFEHLDLLRTWPVRAADVIRGEMAWPVLLVSSIEWAAVLVAALFSFTVLPDAPFISRWSFALAAAFAGPALIAAQFAVHNAATIFFPAWVQIGTQRTRGIDAMGQRLIMLAAIVVSLAIFALPGALAGGVVWFLFHRIAGDVVYVPAAIVFAVVVLVEVLMVTELLGPAYERIDVTSVERAE